MHTESVLTKGLIFLAVCVFSWWLGNKLIWFLWKAIAKHSKVRVGTRTALAGTVGGLERVLYIYAVVFDKYEIITGWLVMKAFFGWIRSEERSTKKEKENKATLDEVSNTYNGFVLGTLLSLLIGLAAGHAVTLMTGDVTSGTSK